MEEENKKKKKEYKFKSICEFCGVEFPHNKDGNTSCYHCFKFFVRFGGIKDYKEFMDAFDMEDTKKSKDAYIKFSDDLKRFLKIYGDWRIDKVLENPEKFLDMVKVGKKRKKKKDQGS